MEMKTEKETIKGNRGKRAKKSNERIAAELPVLLPFLPAALLILPVLVPGADLAPRRKHRS
jgi:hypothetical protein